MERENTVKEMTTHAQIYVEEYSATAAVIIIIMEVKMETEDMFGGSFRSIDDAIRLSRGEVHAV